MDEEALLGLPFEWKFPWPTGDDNATPNGTQDQQGVHPGNDKRRGISTYARSSESGDSQGEQVQMAR